MPMRGYLPVKTLSPDNLGERAGGIRRPRHGDDGTLVFWISILGLAITFYLMVEFPHADWALTQFAGAP